MTEDERQEPNPTGEEPSKDERIAELEQALAEKAAEIAALKQSILELELRLSQAVAAYRAEVIKANPDVPEELITGETIAEVDASLASAQALVERVRRELEGKVSQARIPVGSPLRTQPDLSILSPKEKIQYAIERR